MFVDGLDADAEPVSNLGIGVTTAVTSVADATLLILGLPREGNPGETIYSDPGFILLGKILETVAVFEDLYGNLWDLIQLNQ